MTAAEPLITFPDVVTIAVGSLTWLFGVFIVRRVPFLSRYNFPAPVIGGLVVAVVFDILHEYEVPLPAFDTSLVNTLIIAFFASLGFGASLRVLKKGGRDVIKYLVVCSVVLFLQALLGIGVASLLGEHPLFGVLSSIVSLAGGPATALAFSPSFEAAGVHGASAIGLAAAMGGILVGGLFSGPIATILINKKQLAPAPAAKDATAVDDKSEWISPDQLASQLIWQNAYLLIIGSAGWYLSKGLAAEGIKLPFYIGAMIIAAIVRNIDDATGWFKLNLRLIEAIGSACLTFFIATMMMSLQLWTVASVAGALVVMLVIQTIFISLMAMTVMFITAGKDYDAAVMSGGFVGFMMGTTATSLAAMSTLADKYGPAPRAFLVIPIVGACFIDFVNAIVISIGLNLFG